MWQETVPFQNSYVWIDLLKGAFLGLWSDFKLPEGLYASYDQGMPWGYCWGLTWHGVKVSCFRDLSFSPHLSGVISEPERGQIVVCVPQGRQVWRYPSSKKLGGLWNSREYLSSQTSPQLPFLRISRGPKGHFTYSIDPLKTGLPSALQ